MRYSVCSNRFIVCLVLSVFLFLLDCTPKTTPVPISTQAPVQEPEKPSWELEWEKTVTMARREGKVSLYAAGGVASARDALIQGFRQKYGIELEIQVLSGNQLSAKLLNERRSGIYTADVYLGGSGTPLSQLIPAGVLDPIEPFLVLPEVTNKNIWLAGWPIMDKGRYLFTSTAETSTRIAFNTELIRPTEIKSLKDLLDPKWKGKLVLDDPSLTGVGVGVFHLAKTLYGEDYLRQFLLKQDPFITRDGRQLVEWVVRGKYHIGVGASNGAVKSLADSGASIAMFSRFEKETELRSGAGYLSAVNKAPHPNAKKLLINWILSKDGQTLISKSSGVASRRLDIPTSHLEPSQVPDPTEKYIIETEDYSLGRTVTSELVRKIMAEARY